MLNKKNAVTLPDGDHIQPWALIEAMANAVSPVTKKPDGLFSLYEKLLPSGVRHEMTPADFEYLEQLWGAMPPLHGSTSRSEFAQYLAVFDAAADRPGWTPAPTFHEGRHIAISAWNTAKDECRNAVANGIASGALPALNKFHIPVLNYQDAAGIRRDDAAAYLAQMQFEVIGDGTPPAIVAAGIVRQPDLASHVDRNDTPTANTRKDALALELDDLINDMLNNQERVTAVSVMARLKAGAGNGGCITDVAADGDGLIWERSSGKVETIRHEALAARIGRAMKSTR